MKYLSRILLFTIVLLTRNVIAQNDSALSGTPIQPGSEAGAMYLFNDWYAGSVRTSDNKVHDGVYLRYDLKKDELEYKQGTELYRLKKDVIEFNIPTGTDLYTFKNGFGAVDGQNNESFYRILYEGNTKLLKRYTSPIKIEKASATRSMDPGSKLYILKAEKLYPVRLSDRNSFLKLLADEKNKMLYTIKEQQLEFGAEDDLISLLEEYDSFKAGRGGN